MRSRLHGGATMLLLAFCFTASATGPKAPNPKLTPAEVVQVQLDALAHNDLPTTDAGIAVVWRFASPGNQSQTGPLAQFTRMVHSGYAEMLNHRRAKLAATVMKDGQALQGVELVDQAGVTHQYVFILSRQTDSPYRGCWMTDGVIGSPDDKPALSV